MENQKMGFKFEEEDSDSDDGYVHPNIDRVSWLRWRKKSKEEERQRKQNRLNELRESGECEDERVALEDELRPKFKEASAETVVNCEGVEIDCVAQLEQLVQCNDLAGFIDFMDRNIVNMGKLEDLTLFNLSECIKGDDDDSGILFARIAMFIRYARLRGPEFLRRLAESVKMKGKVMEDLLEKEIGDYYIQSKEAILDVKKGDASA